MPVPLLVAAASASPDFYRGAVGGATSIHVEAQTRLAAHHRAIRVEIPLLVSASVAVPDLHSGACCRGVIGHIQTLVAIHLQLPVGQGGPLLVGSTVAVPDLQQRAVRRRLSWHVQAAVGAHSPQDPSCTTATASTATVVGQAPAILQAVEAGLIVDA
ncbi:MAG TPA: hypothetical protein VFB12_18895 [Ktedonobacteraceae bacterium]|nr:hypothetical protein [Ktedonobacteraceae bacterium]